MSSDVHLRFLLGGVNHARRKSARRRGGGQEGGPGRGAKGPQDLWTTGGRFRYKLVKYELSGFVLEAFQDETEGSESFSPNLPDSKSFVNTDAQTTNN